ncbi:MAG: SdpI family protein [Planctomycetaceae bacterium]
MNPQLFLFLMHLGVAVLLGGCGWPLYRNWVPPNPWYGFRTPATLRDERIWYPVNREAGLWLAALSAVMLVVVVTTWMLDLSVGRMAIINSVPLLLGLTAMTMRGFWQIHQLKQSTTTHMVDET